MTDFGANIFDEEGSPPKKPRARRKPRASKAATEQPSEAPPPPLETAAAEAEPAPDAASDAAAAPPVEPLQRAPDEPTFSTARRAGPQDAPRRREPQGREQRGREQRSHEPRGHGQQGDAGKDAAPVARERAAAARPPRPAPRVALLVDMPALEAEARQQGRELAVTRLLAGLAAGAAVETAVCFRSGRGRAPHGFEVVDAGDPVTSGIRFAAKATELATRGVHLVLAPASDRMVELARMLRDQGHSIELAGFESRDDDVAPTRRLGRECLFVP